MRLHLRCHAPHHRLNADAVHLHHALAVKDHCPAKERGVIDEGIARDLLREDIAAVCRDLRALLRLAVECRVVDAQIACDEHSVRRDLVPALQDHMVPDDDVIHRQDDEPAVAADLCRLLCRTGAQCTVLRVARDIRPRRHRSHQNNGHDRADRLVDLCMPGEVHRDHEHDHHEQNADHRVAERRPERLPERHPCGFRDCVRAVFCTRGLRLGRCKSRKFQGSLPFLNGALPVIPHPCAHHPRSARTK